MYQTQSTQLAGKGRAPAVVWLLLLFSLAASMVILAPGGRPADAAQSTAKKVCQSQRHQPNSCSVRSSRTISAVWVQPGDQMSSSPCVHGQRHGSFWASGDRIHVRDGCRADFTYRYTTAAAGNCTVETAGLTPGSHCGSLPTGPKRWDSPRYRFRSYEPQQTTIGKFRVKCFPSHFAYVDPVAGADHLHAFFGATSVSNSSTPATLRGTESSCVGGDLNATAYWVPALMSKKTGEPIVANHLWAYYKSGYHGISPSNIHGELPDIGTMASAAYQQNHEVWTCKPSNGSSWRRGHSIPWCEGGDLLQMDIHFPQCWDRSTGNNVMLVDPVNKACRDGRVAIPVIQTLLEYRVPDNHTSNDLRLSSDPAGGSAGATAHGDWMNGWKKTVSDVGGRWGGGFLQHCVRTSLDCTTAFRNHGNNNWQFFGQSGDE